MTVSALTTQIGPGERVLALALAGRGKRRLLVELAWAFAERDGASCLLAADPGQPGWGPPTAVSLLRFRAGVAEPEPIGLAAVGTLDPVRRQGRYRTACLAMLERVPPDATALIDAPGVLRAPLAESFVAALLDGLGVTWLLAVGDDEPVTRLLGPLADRPSLSIARLAAQVGASPPSKSERRRRRTEAWEQYLGEVEPRGLDLSDRQVTQSDPRDGRDGWDGRVVALLSDDGRTLGLGEVAVARGADAENEVPTELFVRSPLASFAAVRTVELASAARRDGSGLRTVGSKRGVRARVPPPWTLPARPQARIPIQWPVASGQALWEPRFLNALTGDPALMLRHRRLGRALLFDLGWLDPLPTRLLHAVSDVFVTHGHMDHLQGLVTLLRVLLGPGGTVRLYGPPGLLRHVEALLRAFDFGLLEANGPRFVVHELEGERVTATRLRCAAPPSVEELGARAVLDGVVLEEPGLVVRAVTLVHRGPVLAFRVEMPRRRRLRHGEDFAHDYTLAYVTDVADSPTNRAAIVELARGADLFVCEAAFAEEHRARAEETGHLTARACGELAREAGVTRLVPFHFSARYHDDPGRIYREVMEEFREVVPAVPVAD